MCDLEQRIITTADYDAFCVRDLMTNECCRPWSIPNYVALLANRTHCFDLIADDVRYVQNLLTTCFPFYHDLRLDSDCVNFRCRNVPAECTQFNAVYNIFHFLADNQFMSVNVSHRRRRPGINPAIFLKISPPVKHHNRSVPNWPTRSFPVLLLLRSRKRQYSCAKPWFLSRWPRAPRFSRSTTACRRRREYICVPPFGSFLIIGVL